MIDFRVRQKFKTSKPMLRVDPGLPVGRYRFQLTVTDRQGNVSKPALVEVHIVRGRRLPNRQLTDPQ